MFIPPGIREVINWNIVKYNNKEYIIGWDLNLQNTVRSTAIKEQISNDEFVTESGSQYKTIGDPKLNAPVFEHFIKTFGGVECELKY